MRLAPALLLAALALPAAAAKEPGIANPDAPTPVTLYMHLIDFQDFPINTQVPDDNWTQDTTYGVLTSTTSCLPEGTPGYRLSQAWHTFYGYSSPSYVEYLFEEGGSVRVHPERGISYDARLDPATPFTLYWYLSTQGPLQAPADGADPDSVPVAMPNVVVQATMRAGDAVSVDDRAYNSGPVLVRGRTAPATLLADQVLPGLPGGAAPPEVRALGQQGGRWLYEFAVPMAIESPTIPRGTGYNLRVDVYMDNPACADPTGDGGGGALMANTAAIHSSPAHRPRMEFAVTNPIVIEALHPQFVGDELVVHVATNAVWGNYDVAEPSPYTPQVGDAGLQVAIEGPSPAPGLRLAGIGSHTHPHYMHQEPVTLAYAWPYKADGAKDGLYTVTVKVGNDQGTATAVGVSQFEVGRQAAVECTAQGCAQSPGPGGEGGRDAPALPGVALAGLVAAAAVLGRRR